MYGFWKNKRIVLFDTLLSKEMNELMKQLGEESKSEHKKAEDETDNEAEPNKTTELEDAEQEKLEEAVRRFHGDDGDDETTNDANNLEEKPLLNTDEEKDEGKNGTAAEKEHRIGMDDDEVVAVLGHELGHWKLCHSAALLAITEFNLLFTLFIFSVFYQQESLFTAFGFPPPEQQQQQQPILIGLLLIGQFVMAPYTEFLSLAINVFTRKFEFAAGRFSVTLGHALKLCCGLIKLGKDNLSLPIDDWLYSWCNHSHPPTPERMEALKKFA
uniref:Peptidase M48 domain-containing protein n=1 Tax=Globodera rostochiensis TaxID=31243 RepID=A0A914HGC2_GLORO